MEIKRKTEAEIKGEREEEKEEKEINNVTERYINEEIKRGKKG